MDFFLNAFHIGKGDLWVFDDVNVSGFAVFVDAEESGGKLLRVGLADELFALQHSGENEACILGVILIFLH